LTKDWTVAVTPATAGWRYAGLRTTELAAGTKTTFSTGPDEALIVPLSGSCIVACDGGMRILEGRASVFDGPTDFAYVPRDSIVEMISEKGCRIAVPTARAEERLHFDYGPRENVRVEQRGAGSALRTVRNFCTPDAFACDRLMAVEVVTPGGNWSSWPPHKHDVDILDDPHGERAVEEIYYYEGGPGYQRVYSSAVGDIDVLREVTAGDVVLVPFGYHGPSMAAPGYDLYYLNVLASAGRGKERSMAFSDDPRHAWVRGSWTSS
jgi:5-deoxy-glucuronate isomerase